MRKLVILASVGIFFTTLGCGNSQKAASAPRTAAVPSVQGANQQGWLSENVKDSLGSVVALKQTSLDGKFDLVILQRGDHSFLSFVRHTRWEAVHSQPAKGKLMNLSVKFEDGDEKHSEWDELGFATEDLYSVLWSYPVKTGAASGPVPEGAQGESGGDQLLVQEMMKHKTMSLEVEPGVMAQFDMNGLAGEMEKLRAAKTQPALGAGQTGE